MKYFVRPDQERIGNLFKRHEVSHPEHAKLEAIKRMKRAGGVSKVFAPSLTVARERALHENQNKNNDILRKK